MTPKLYLRAIPALLLLFVFATPGLRAQTSTLDSEQAAFVTLINNFRAQNGAGPLQVSVALQNASQWMSADMAAKNYFSHTDSLGRTPFARMQSFGYPYSPNGENVAAGYADAQNAFNQWLNACDPDSTGKCTYAHRLNMLNPNFRVLGVGRAYNANSTYRWYWTTDFGGVVDQTMSSSTVADTLPPSIPSLSGSAASATSVKLTWTASTDNTGVKGYQVSRNGAVLATVTAGTSYTDTAAAPSTTYTYSVKAFDAANNYSQSSNAVTVVTPAATTTTPTTASSIFAATASPQWIGSSSAPVELGVKFRSDVNGKIAGIRFFKPFGESGTHTGSLWTTAGVLLATGTFTNETASGWQTLLFNTPVSIAANTVYIASYHAKARFGMTPGGFANAGVYTSPLHALRTGVAGANGAYGFGPTTVFPGTGSAGGDNYWVDVLFTR